MRILVKESQGKAIRILLPSWFLFNGLSAHIAAKALAEQGITIPPSQLKYLFRELRVFKRKHPGWKLVEVQSHDGDRVEITL